MALSNFSHTPWYRLIDESNVKVIWLYYFLIWPCLKSLVFPFNSQGVVEKKCQYCFWLLASANPPAATKLVGIVEPARSSLHVASSRASLPIRLLYFMLSATLLCHSLVLPSHRPGTWGEESNVGTLYVHRTRIASRPSRAIQLHSAIQRYTL